MLLSELPTCDRKCQHIYRKARARGIPYTKMIKHLQMMYGVKHSHELTLEQYQAVLNLLDQFPINKEKEKAIIEKQRNYFNKNKDNPNAFHHHKKKINK